ncbi:MAG: glycosyltransferase [Patescibacteria group bacterium]|nr:glycosyltransferase [Patescibacteria group bacterium]
MTENQKLVSIIIPAYNAAEYVEEAVRSALAQTYSPCEVIVVDDGSTDSTADIVTPYAERGEVIFIPQTNKGLASARNTGIRNAHGAYIALLDSDDMFLPEKITQQVAALEEHPEYGVCYSDLLHFVDPPAGARTGSMFRKFYHHRYSYPSGDIFEPLLHRQFINPLTVMVRREVIEKHGMFDESLRRSEDWDLWLRWAYAGVKFLYLNNPLAHYRIVQSGSNLSSVKSEPEMKEKNLDIFVRIGERLSEDERRRYRFNTILSAIKKKVVFAYLMTGDKKTALRRAKELTPSWWWLVRCAPRRSTALCMGIFRKFKHRTLLKKSKSSIITNQ